MSGTFLLVLHFLNHPSLQSASKSPIPKPGTRLPGDIIILNFSLTSTLSLLPYSTRPVAHCSKHQPSVVATDGRKSGRGNVHTGATPPWLREDDEDEDGGLTFGPSEEEFIKHSE